MLASPRRAAQHQKYQRANSYQYRRARVFSPQPVARALALY